MPDDTNRTRRARERQQRTGKKYTEALNAEGKPGSAWDLERDELTAEIAGLEHALSQQEDPTAQRRLAELYGVGKLKAMLWFIPGQSDPPGWSEEAKACMRRCHDHGGEHQAQLIMNDPDSEWAQNLTPDRLVQDKPVRVSSQPSPQVQEAWDRLAAKDPRHQGAADRYRNDAAGDVIEVLERWALSDPSFKDWVDKANKEGQEAIEADG